MFLPNAMSASLGYDGVSNVIHLAYIVQPSLSATTYDVFYARSSDMLQTIQSGANEAVISGEGGTLIHEGLKHKSPPGIVVTPRQLVIAVSADEGIIFYISEDYGKAWRRV